MGRPSNRQEKRAEILTAFARVLADHGYAGATVQKIAVEAGIAPGLVHHHFENKDELLASLLEVLAGRFRKRLEALQFTASACAGPSALELYADAALKLDERADTVAAKCWVGLFAEALRSPTLFRRVRRLLEGELSHIQVLSHQRLDDQQASAVLAFILGCLVFGAFAPRKTAGFAAPALKRFLRSLS